MKRILFAFAAVTLFLPATAQTSRAADVSVDFFYNNISGGSWIEVGDYGYCWQPDIAVSDTSWRPYADGYWAYTDLGWTWVSYEDFGWATYHYGRWARLPDQGWVWVPGRDQDLEWGPAWVSWRTGGEYVGWAPLPPQSIGVVYEGRPITGHVDVEFDIGPAYYNFVEVRYIGEPVLRERIVASNLNVTYISQTVNVTNITYKNKVVYNYGPDITVINQHAARPIQRLKLERQENVDFTAAAKSGGLMKPQGDRLMVAAPMRITKSQSQVAPPTVKTRVAKANFDRGWGVVGDEKAQTELKEKIKGQDLKKIPPITAGGASEASAATGGQAAAPAAAASASASGAAATPTDVSENRKDRDRSRLGDKPEEKASPGSSVDASAETGLGKRGEKIQGNAAGATGGERATAPATGTPAGKTMPGSSGLKENKGGKIGDPGAVGSTDERVSPAGEPRTGRANAATSHSQDAAGNDGKPNGPNRRIEPLTNAPTDVQGLAPGGGRMNRNEKAAERGVGAHVPQAPQTQGGVPLEGKGKQPGKIKPEETVAPVPPQ